MNAGHVHPHALNADCHCTTCRPLERPCGCEGCAAQELKSAGYTLKELSAGVFLLFPTKKRTRWTVPNCGGVQCASAVDALTFAKTYGLIK